MGISEKQLDTWSSQGAVSQSKSTYATVRNTLEREDAPYNGKKYSIFLQGSYGNDTNIYADSDVDVVILLSSIYYDNLEHLSEDDKVAYKAAKISTDYTYDLFKSGVNQHLAKSFGSSVNLGKKAIFIEGNGARRDCDVLAAVELRRYTSFKSHNDCAFESGICFWTSDGVQIINFPKQHSENCTAKHQRTANWFKPTVRILKNMRNTMIERGHLKDGVAPSYFLEGMLYNVPDETFGTSYEDTIVKSINWIINCDRSKLLCANELYYLCHPTSPVTWRAENLNIYLDAVSEFWTNARL